MADTYTNGHSFDDNPDETEALRQQYRQSKANGFREPLRIRDFDEIDFDLDAETWLIEGLLLAEEISLIHGPTNTGKTFLALDLNLTVAAGGEWFGRKVTAGRVVYVAAEGGKRIDKRIAAWKQHHGYLRRGEKLPFSLIAESVDLCHAEAGDVQRTIAAIRGKIGNEPLALLTVETVNSVMNGGNENGPEDMGRLVANIRHLRDEFHCAVLLIHHPARGGNTSRGHYSLPCAVDTEFAVDQDESSVVTVTMTKQREAERADPFCFKLRVIELGHNSAGKLVTSCVIEQTDLQKPDRAERKLSPREQIALSQLTNAVNIAGMQLPASNHGTTGKLGVPIKIWREYCRAGGVAAEEGPETRRKAILRVTEKLISLKLVGNWNDVVWTP